MMADISVRFCYNRLWAFEMHAFQLFSVFEIGILWKVNNVKCYALPLQAAWMMARVRLLEDCCSTASRYSMIKWSRCGCQVRRRGWILWTFLLQQMAYVRKGNRALLSMLHTVIFQPRSVNSSLPILQGTSSILAIWLRGLQPLMQRLFWLMLARECRNNRECTP